MINGSKTAGTPLGTKIPKYLNPCFANPIMVTAIKINSAIILKNASTQFADGGEFGFGAEIGISTDKLHVRGPVGSEHLTSFKYVIHGNGQVRT